MDGTGQKLAILARDSVTSISKVFVFGLTLQTNSVFESDVICENMSPTCVLYQSNPRKVCGNTKSMIRLELGVHYISDSLVYKL